MPVLYREGRTNMLSSTIPVLNGLLIPVLLALNPLLASVLAALTPLVAGLLVIGKLTLSSAI